MNAIEVEELYKILKSFKVINFQVVFAFCLQQRNQDISEKHCAILRFEKQALIEL